MVDERDMCATWFDWNWWCLTYFEFSEALVYTGGKSKEAWIDIR